jgi:regulator of CtrA degradation
MIRVTSINPRVVEALYVEALVLADAARGRFDELRQTAGARGRAVIKIAPDRRIGPDDVEVMCEALRTTTRVMHCLAWLLNHRAWFAGEISAVQLRRHGRLISHFPASDPTIVDRLPEDLADLVHDSERLYARIQRLETAWRAERTAAPGAIERLRDRLALNALRQA